MSKTPWTEKKSMLDLTSSRSAKGLDPIDMGFIYRFKNKDVHQFNDDNEAYRFYEQHKEKLDKEPE